MSVSDYDAHALQAMFVLGVCCLVAGGMFGWFTHLELVERGRLRVRMVAANVVFALLFGLTAFFPAMILLFIGRFIYFAAGGA